MRALILGLVLASALAKADSYVVLFKQSEIGIASLGHEAYQTLLQSGNQKSIDQLEEWLGRRNRAATPVTDLWLVRGAALELDAEQAAVLAKEPWVGGVYPDLKRRLVPEVKPRAARAVSQPWGLGRIGVPKIRKEFPKLDGTGVRVGILDTGIQSRHPEFRRPTEPGAPASFIRVKFKDFVNGLPNPYDDHGHGTHVAGTIAGLQVGIAPNVDLVVAKVFTANGFGQDSQLLAAMQWVFDPDGDPKTADFAQVVSNSWGADLAGEVIAHDIQTFELYRLAVQSWVTGGVVPVFAAGNSGGSPNGMPGGLPEALAVGALDNTDLVAEFSSRGPNLWRVGQWVLSVLKPDISAPGVDVHSAMPGNEYGLMSGTSMATPHVSGAVALALQANHKLKYGQLKEALSASSEYRADVHHGYGILNAYELVKLVQAK